MKAASLFVVSLCILGSSAVIAGESREQWYTDGRDFVANAKKLAPITAKAKNIILFLGDGMGVTTVTAARILEGQQQGKTGEENVLSFEKFPYSALIKTYNTNQQVPDSAGTMTAIVAGVKTKAGVLSVDQDVTRGDHTSMSGNEVTTILEMAEKAGLSTGVVTNMTVTHATPGACYAHTPEREWEDDAGLTKEARAAGFPDIARQLIEFPIGNGLEVALGGGRSYFLPSTVDDPEESSKKGRRLDGRDLTTEWQKKSNAAYVWNKSQFDAIDPAKVDHLLGLFDPLYLEYEIDRASDTGGEPSLSEMTRKAIDVVSKNEKGYFLMVEGGQIDRAHHSTNAYRALTETIEFANAVRVAVEKTKREETLIVVTADHSHVFVMGGHATRGNPILGLVWGNKRDGQRTDAPKKDALGLPFTTLSYANGPGYAGESASQPEGSKKFDHEGKGFKGITHGRPELKNTDVQAPSYLQECLVPLEEETHSGEDVPLYADGPSAHLFRGVMEQNVIFHVMAEALQLQP